MSKYSDYKPVKKLYLKCQNCGQQDEKVSNDNEYDIILCVKCLKNKKNNNENNIVRGDYCSKNGKVEYDKDGRVVCYECGQSFESLSAHLYPAHKMTVKEYKSKHGLKIKDKLTSEKYQNKHMSNVKSKNLLPFRKGKDNNDQCTGQLNIDDYNL